MLKRLLAWGLLFCSFSVIAEPVIYRVGVKENLEFLEKDRNERMDLYYPADPRPGDKFPGIVIIHGGSWCRGIRNAEREINIGTNLARMGYVCISIDYRLANPENLAKYGKTFPVNIQDCKKAVIWLRKNAEYLHLDPQKIGCIGGSAGGHLATLLSVAGAEVGLEPENSGKKADSSIQACINLYGVTDFAGFRTGNKRSKYRTQVMGSTPDQDRTEWTRCSPVELVDANDPPMLQIYASADKVVPFHQAELMKEELDRKGVYNEYILLDGFGHVFNLQRWRGKPLPRMVRQRVLAFYDRFLKNLSPEDAEKRFIALEKFEKAHPKSAYYGISTLSNGKVDNTKQGLAIVSSGQKSRFEAAFDMKLEKLTRTEITASSAGKTVIVSGKKGADGTLECQQIVFPGEYLKAVSGVRGILKKCDNSWTLEVEGKKTVKLNISAAARIYNCIPVKMEEIKSGWQVKYLRARNYGDLCKIIYGLFADR